MFSFTSPMNFSAGIQITDHLIRYVAFEFSKKSMKTKAFGEEFISAGVVEEGKIVDPAGLTATLTTLRKKHALKEVTIVLPEEQSLIFYTNVPFVSGQELDQVIRDHVYAYLHLHSKLSVKELVCEYDVLGKQDGNYSLQVTVTPKTIIESYMKVFKDAGFDPKILEVGSHMISQACLKDNDGMACMVVDFGKDKTNISTVSDGRVMSSDTIPVGHEHLDRVIEEFLNVNSHDAMKIRKKFGLLRTHREPELLAKLFHEISPIRDYLDRRFIKWHLKKYKDSKERNPIKKIILHGEGANISGFAEHLAVSTRIPVEYADVWRHLPEFKETIPNIHKEDTLRYATAISGALQGIYGKNY